MFRAALGKEQTYEEKVKEEKALIRKIELKHERLAHWRKEELQKVYKKRAKEQKRLEKELKKQAKEHKKHLDEMLGMFDPTYSESYATPKKRNKASLSSAVTPTPNAKSRKQEPITKVLEREVAEMMSMGPKRSSTPKTSQPTIKAQPQPEKVLQRSLEPEASNSFDGPEWDNYRELYNSLPMEAKMTIDKQIAISKTDKLEWVKAFEPSLRKMLTKQKHRAPNRSYGYSTPAPSFR